MGISYQMYESWKFLLSDSKKFIYNRTDDVCLSYGESLHIFQIKLSECDECCPFLVLLLSITMLYSYGC